jgi:hypothetical protein
MPLEPGRRGVRAEVAGGQQQRRPAQPRPSGRRLRGALMGARSAWRQGLRLLAEVRCKCRTEQSERNAVCVN